MADRITTKDLNVLLARLHRETGRPALEWTPHEDGCGYKCDIGALFFVPGSQPNGRAWALCETVDAGGAHRTMLRARTAAGLHAGMEAYLQGWTDALRVRS